MRISANMLKLEGRADEMMGCVKGSMDPTFIVMECNYRSFFVGAR